MVDYFEQSWPLCHLKLLNLSDGVFRLVKTTQRSAYLSKTDKLRAKRLIS
jgi:hypothetical protein